MYRESYKHTYSGSKKFEQDFDKASNYHPNDKLPDGYGTWGEWCYNKGNKDEVSDQLKREYKHSVLVNRYLEKFLPKKKNRNKDKYLDKDNEIVKFPSSEKRSLNSWKMQHKFLFYFLEALVLVLIIIGIFIFTTLHS